MIAGYAGGLPYAPELCDEIVEFTTKVVVMSVLQRIGDRFRADFYGCPSARADAFFELTDALLCAEGPTRTPVSQTFCASFRAVALAPSRPVAGMTGAVDLPQGFDARQRAGRERVGA